jgi:hypothetical protein
VRSESRCALRLIYIIWLSVSKLPLKSAVVSLYSVVKQRLKCNAGKVCNCVIQFLLTVVLSLRNVFYKSTATFRKHCIVILYYDILL